MNIKEWVFGDIATKEVKNANDTAVCVGIEKGVSWIAIYKSDVIAMAKHFKLKVSDIGEE